MTQEEIAKRVVTALEDNGVPYMLTGALAVNYYGRPRLTHDIDVIVEMKLEKHMLDVRGICQLQSDALDKQYLKNWARRLSVEDLLPEHSSWL